MERVSRFALTITIAIFTVPAMGQRTSDTSQGKPGSASHGSHDLKPQHGGTVAEVQEIAFELVIKPDSVVLYLTDHGKPLSTAGAKGTLTLLTGSQKLDVALTPAATNELRGTADLKAMGGAKAVATVSLAGKKMITVRFSSK